MMNAEYWLLSASLLFTWSTSPARAQELLWRSVGPTEESEFGWALAMTGDLDADGVGDVLIGSTVAGSSQNGRIYAYSSTGRLLYSIQRSGTGGFGYAVGGRGDLDGDGVDDIAAGAPSESTGASFNGAVHLYSGIDGSPLGSIMHDVHRELFGSSVSISQDIDLDGLADLLVGAPGGLGRAVVYSGSTSDPLWNLIGEQTYSQFGNSVAFLPDLDSDGVPDFLVGAPYYEVGQSKVGRAYLYSGATAATLAIVEGSGSPTLTLGSAVAPANDFNGDSVSDFLITAPFGGAGKVFLYSGKDRSLLLEINGPQEGSWFGVSVASAGDVNLDGIQDIVIGSPSFYESCCGLGAVFVVSGDDGRILVRLSASPWEGPQGVGTTVASSADWSGDGFGEILLGAIGYCGHTFGCSQYPGGYVAAYSMRVAPSLYSVLPDEGIYDLWTPVILKGRAFRFFEEGRDTEVRFDGVTARNLQILSDLEIQCEAPPGSSGFADVSVRNRMGESTLSEGYLYRPAILEPDDVSPGGDLRITTLCQSGDFLFGILGLPPPLEIPTPPFDGTLCTSAFFVMYLVPYWPFDEFFLDLPIPDDPSLSGLDLLFQSLIGPSDRAVSRGTTWTNCVMIRIR